jgi:glycosyltransferase involved in cell wall biosynthesis
MISNIKPIRVLHDLHCLRRGGLETSLMNYLRYFKNKIIHFDFAVCDNGHYDDEVKSLGSIIHRVSHPIHYYRFINDMRNIMKTGNYDVLHCHRPEHAAILLKIAKELGIRCRIVHARDSMWCLGQKSLFNSLRYFRYIFYTRRLLYHYATHLLAVSTEAGCYYFGDLFTKHKKCSVLLNGVILSSYDVPLDTTRRISLLNHYGLDSDSIVIATVGSLSIAKNHSFLLQVFKVLAEQDKRYVLFIAGEGDRRNRLEEEIRAMGLTNRVVMPGICFNILELECYLFDVFCFPSLFEGLPNSVLEAISAGLFSVCADTITNDLFSYFPERTVQLNLNTPLTKWADALENGIKQRKTHQEGIAIVQQTPFSIENSAQALLKIYKTNLE